MPARAEQSPQKRLQDVEKALGESRAHQDAATEAVTALGTEIAELRKQSVAAAQAAQADEASLTATEGQLRALAAEERAKSDALERDRAHQTALLMSLVQLAAAPPEGLMLRPGTPLDAMRAALLMGHALPPINAQAETLRRDIAALEDVRRDTAAARAKQRREGTALAEEQARLAQLIARKSVLLDAASRNADESRKRVTVLAAEASSLHDLIDRLEAERKAEAERREAEQRPAGDAHNAASPPTTAPPAESQVAVVAPPPARTDPTQPRKIRPFSEAQGAMVYPASGTLVLRYGAPDAYGGTTRGLTFETRPGAQVVAPFDGQVLFAGPFRGYGQILIIGHGDGYHSLLAGLDRLDSSVGQWLVAGEPVGTMPDGADKPRLYLELRHNNQPINPLPWLATRVEKVNG